MKFEISTKLIPFLFYNVELEENKPPQYFFPVRQLGPATNLVAGPYALTENIYTNFFIRAVGFDTEATEAANIVGFLFKSNLPVFNYRTAILSYARAWQLSTTKVTVSPEETALTLKGEHFLMYHVPGKATLITSMNLHEDLHDYLTMI